MDTICRQAAERLVDELKKDCTKSTIEREILDPMVKYIGGQLYPYVISAAIALCLMFLVLIYLIYLSFRMNRVHHA